jgi:hypothetical protein
LPHIDTKKLGRIERPSHRVTGNRRDSVEGAAYGRFWPGTANTFAPSGSIQSE